MKAVGIQQKKKQPKKPKQTDPSEIMRNDGVLSQQQLPRESDIAFSSLLTMHFNGEAVPVEGTNLQTRHSDGKDMLKSCPKIIGREGPAASYPSNGFMLQQSSPQRKLYAPHWPIEAVNEALEKGHIFKAMFRVNAHNRIEGYCYIDGIQTDVLINGIGAQNRAVEGDIVAIKVDPLSCWTRLKGFAGTSHTSLLDDCNSPSGMDELVDCSHKGKNKVEVLDLCKVACDQSGVASSVEKLSAIVNSFPSKRPTGRVVSIIEGSPRRDAVVGFLNAKQFLVKDPLKRENKKKNGSINLDGDYIMLIPNDPKFTKMMVFVRDLPSSIVKRLQEGDTTIENELVGAWVCGWDEGNYVPHARVVHIFGRGGEIEPHIAAILFENAIDTSDFRPELLSNLPSLSWNIPNVELRNRRDLRNLCIFTIDPSTATDLDDALSVERLPNGNFRVGVHIADASYFVQPDTALDKEAQVRANSVYLSRGKLPMLPSMLSDNVGSLNPGIDRLAFSIIWDISPCGVIVDRWIGRTIIRSCCKLSYGNVQVIIDGLPSEGGCVQVHGNFEWSDVCKSVQSLSEISKMLKTNRYNSGALCLNSSKLSFLLDDDGIPYESMVSESMDSNFLVEEFMLLANTAAAEVIYKAYPNSALLRMHPEPQVRKLKEFEAFCMRHGLELDTTSSAQFHRSIEGFKGKLENDPVLFNILVNYATKSMQLAKYFSSGEIKDGLDNWGHYTLGVPMYTHFTSPLRRYADIVVHRTLAATIEAEEMYSNLKRTTQKVRNERDLMQNCFTGICFNKIAAKSPEGKAALSAAASRNGVPCTEKLVEVAAHCNQRKLACRSVQDASNRLYMWFILKKEQILLTEARVLALGPRFMTIYIPRLAIERRIYYDEVEELVVEWLDATSTLLVSLSTARKRSQRRGSPGNRKTLEEVALLTCPLKLKIDLCDDYDEDGFGNKKSDLGNKSLIRETEPAEFPLTVNLLSTIPVALHAIGGDNGPLDIGARLYLSTYLI